MRAITDNCGSTSGAFCRFHHRFIFWVSNLYEIVSMQVINFNAGLQHFVDKDGYFWGQYELIVDYRRHHRDEKPGQRRFTRGFIANIPYVFPGMAGEECRDAAGYLQKQKQLAYEVEYSRQIVPLFPRLFSLFNRLHFVPFKVIIHVYGEISKVETEGDSGKYNLNKNKQIITLEKGPVTRELPGSLPTVLKGAAVAREAHVQRSAGEEEDFLDLDLIALEQKNDPVEENAQEEKKVPVSGPRSQQLYYQMLQQHQKDLHGRHGS